MIISRRDKGSQQYFVLKWVRFCNYFSCLCLFQRTNSVRGFSMSSKFCKIRLFCLRIQILVVYRTKIETLMLHLKTTVDWGEVLTFSSSTLFPDATKSLFSFQVVISSESNRTFLWKHDALRSLNDLQAYLIRNIVQLQKNRISFFRHDWRKRLFCMRENNWKA